MEVAIMSAFTSAANEALTLINEIQPELKSAALAGDPANETALDADESESNSWVEALLRESPAETLDFGAASLDTARRVVIYQGRYIRFSPLDFALLLVLARQKNRMISYARIYRRLWGPICKVSVPRLRVHVFRVRHKLQEKRMEGIRIINRGGIGYMIEIDAQALRRPVRRKELESGPRPSSIMTASRSFNL